MAQPHLDSRYSWFRLAICVLAGTITCIGMWAVVLVLPAVQEDFAISRSAASLAYTGAMVGFAAGNLLLGRLVDRYGIAPVLAGSAVIMAASFALSTTVNSIWTFALLQALVGFAASSGFGPLLVDISHWFYRRRGIAVACAACGNYFAGAIWPFILKDIIAGDGWRPAFLLIAILCLVLTMPLAAMLMRRPPRRSLVIGGTDRAEFGSREIDLSPRALQFLLVIAGIGCCVAMAMPQVHIVAYCADLGFGVTVGAQMLSTMLAAGIVSRIAFGFVADWIGGVRTVLISSVLQCMALFFYIPFNGLASLYLVSLIFGLSQGGIIPSYAIIVREYLPASEAGQRVGIVIMATVFGMAFGGWLSGLIYDMTGSYQAAFVNGIAWNFVNIAVMVLLLTRSRQNRALAAT
jgi:MFS family permease